AVRRPLVTRRRGRLRRAARSVPRAARAPAAPGDRGRVHGGDFGRARGARRGLSGPVFPSFDSRGRSGDRLARGGRVCRARPKGRAERGAGSRVTRILGVSAYYHDSAACLVVDGEILAAAQEERFTRRKHDASFPSHAVAYWLREGGIGIDDVDLVGFYEKPLVKFGRLLETYVGYAPRGVRSYLTALPVWLGEKLWMGDAIARELNYSGEVLFGSHHESHAASAFYPSPFERAAIVTMDGVGEWATSSVGVGRGNEIEL